MNTSKTKTYNELFRKAISGLILCAFLTGQIFTPTLAGAQVLPAGSVAGLSAGNVAGLPISGISVSFQPPVLLGLKVHPENPLLFDFIVDQGQSKLSADELKSETEKLVKYFLAALTIPDKEVWVNLSPYEKDRIIPDVLGQTTMGKTMLEQDYLLKQLASSLTNPETDLGKKYWDQVNWLTNDQQRDTNPQPLDTKNFNKVWIMPAKAEVLESNGIVLVGEKRLKVMMAEEYENGKTLDAGRSTLEKDTTANVQRPATNVSSEVFRATILPNIEKEVNEGKNFADVRQIYNSVILAAWYKKALKESLLGKVYADKSKVAGVETDDKEMKQRIYEQYLAAFKKGAYNFIKEEEDASGELIPRKYFSGGITSLTPFPEDFNVRLVPSSVLQARIDQASSALIATVQGMIAPNEQEAVQAKAAASGVTQEKISESARYLFPTLSVFDPKQNIRSLDEISRETLRQLFVALFSVFVKGGAIELTMDEVKKVIKNSELDARVNNFNPQKEDFSSDDEKIVKIMRDYLLYTWSEDQFTPQLNIWRYMVREKAVVLTNVEAIPFSDEEYGKAALISIFPSGVTSINLSALSATRIVVPDKTKTSFQMIYDIDTQLNVDIYNPGKQSNGIDFVWVRFAEAGDNQGILPLNVQGKWMQILSLRQQSVPLGNQEGQDIILGYNLDGKFALVKRIGEMGDVTLIGGVVANPAFSASSGVESVIKDYKEAIMRISAIPPDEVVDKDHRRQIIKSYLEAYRNLIKGAFLQLERAGEEFVVVNPLMGGDPVLGLERKTYPLTIGPEDFQVGKELAWLLGGDAMENQYLYNLIDTQTRNALDVDQYKQLPRLPGQHFVFVLKGLTENNWDHSQGDDQARIKSMLGHVFKNVLKPGDRILMLWDFDRDRYLSMAEDAGFKIVINETINGDHRFFWEKKSILLPRAFVWLEKMEAAVGSNSIQHTSAASGVTSDGKIADVASSTIGEQVKLAKDLTPEEFDSAWTAYMKQHKKTFYEYEGFSDYYQKLLESITRPVKEALLDDPSLRLVFLQLLPDDSVGDLVIMNEDLVREKINGTTILDFMKRHRGFLVGDTLAALKAMKRQESPAPTIIAGVVDRYSEYSPFGVASGRQAYFPFGDGTWLGVKGSGQYVDREEPPDFPALMQHRGLISETEAKNSLAATKILNDKNSLFVQSLGYQRIYKRPSGNGELLPFGELKRPDASQLAPVLIFNRVIYPQRHSQIDLLIQGDKGLKRLSRIISETMANLGMLPTGSILSSKDLFLTGMKRRGAAEAMKQNKKLYKGTIKSQDMVPLVFQEADIEEVFPYEQYMKRVKEKQTTEGDTAILRDYGISTDGILLVIEILQDSLRYFPSDKADSLFPIPQEAFKVFFQEYFSLLNIDYLKVWATPVTVGGAQRPLPMKEWFTPLIAEIDPDYKSGSTVDERQRLRRKTYGLVLQLAQEALEKKLTGEGANQVFGASSAVTQAQIDEAAKRVIDDLERNPEFSKKIVALEAPEKIILEKLAGLLLEKAIRSFVSNPPVEDINRWFSEAKIGKIFSPTGEQLLPREIMVQLLGYKIENERVIHASPQILREVKELYISANEQSTADVQTQTPPVSSSGIVSPAFASRLKKLMLSVVTGLLLFGANVSDGMSAEIEEFFLGSNAIPSQVAKPGAQETWPDVVKSYLKELGVSLDLLGDREEILKVSFALAQKENPGLSSEYFSEKYLPPVKLNFQGVGEYLYSLVAIRSSDFTHVIYVQAGAREYPVYFVIPDPKANILSNSPYRAYSLGEQGEVVDVIRAVSQVLPGILKDIKEADASQRNKLMAEIFAGMSQEGIAQFLFKDTVNHELLHSALSDFLFNYPVDLGSYPTIFNDGKNDPNYGFIIREIPVYLGQIALSSQPKYQLLKMFSMLYNDQDKLPTEMIGVIKMLANIFGQELNYKGKLDNGKNITELLGSNSNAALKAAAEIAFKKIMGIEIPKIEEFIIPSPVIDRALGPSASSGVGDATVASAPTEVGGIDFDPTNMNLQIKRDGKGVPLPLPQQDLEQINIQGLFPVIINIVPVNAQTLPIFLGEAPKEPAREPEFAT